MAKEFKTKIDANMANFFDESEKEKPKKKKAEDAPKTEQGTIPEGYELRPERKTKRLQLLLTNTTLEKLKRKAAAEGKSVNELANEIFTEHLKGV